MNKFPVEETYYYTELKKLINTVTGHMKDSCPESSDSDFYEEPNVIYDDENGIVDGYYAFKYSTTDKDIFDKAMQGLTSGIDEIRDEAIEERLSVIGKPFKQKLSNEYTLYSYVMAIELQQGAYNRIKKSQAKEDNAVDREFGFSKGKR